MGLELEALGRVVLDESSAEEVLSSILVVLLGAVLVEDPGSVSAQAPSTAMQHTSAVNKASFFIVLRSLLFALFHVNLRFSSARDGRHKFTL